MAKRITHAGSSSHPRTEDTAQGKRSATRKRRWLLASVLSVSILLLATTATGAATRVYSIVYGDTLKDIATANSTDIATLSILNALDDPDMIIAGEDLAIPDGTLTTYTVEEGDTLATIAAAFNLTVNEIAAVNKIEDPDLIQTGQTLLLYVADGTVDSAEGAIEEVAGEQAEEPDEVEASDESAGAGEDLSDSAPEPEGNDQPVSGRLHLVVSGETLADVAEAYGVSISQLVAANALESEEVSAGMILKIPLSETTGVELVGMPSRFEQWPLMSELAAASLATAYWGAPVTPDEILASLERSENPHIGFRGDPQGMFGMTTDYGVYSGPLADALNALGFSATAFYADGDELALTSWLDAGTPVVVWITHELDPQERVVVESELGRYSLVAEQHAALVYGYDDAGIKVMDVGTGSSAYWSWDDFMASWSLFDGMALAIDLE